MSFHQGEHVALIGQTGSGKTTLARELLKLRTYTLVLVTKPDNFMWPGRWKRVARVRDINLEDNTHFLLRPAYNEQQNEIGAALLKVWSEGGWTVYFDELYYIEQQLKLQEQVVQLLTQGRSLNITAMVGIQRPAWVSRFALSEPTHIFCGRLGDQRDAGTIKSIIGSEYLDMILSLPRYKFAYLNKVTGSQIVVDKNNVIKMVTGG